MLNSIKLSKEVKYLAMLGIVLLILVYFFRIKDKNWQNVMVYDPTGYYTYLTSLFIENDITVVNDDMIYVRELNGKKYNKFTYGMALIYSPFFLTAHAITKFTNFESDGYSLPYILLICSGAILYLLIGFWYLIQLLKTYELSDFAIWLTILLLLIGTNLLIFSVKFGSSPHVYSFVFIAGFLYYIRKYFLSSKSKYLIFAAIFFTIVFLIRPFNALIITAVPILMATDFLSGVRQLLRSWKYLILGSVIFLAGISIQLYVWYLQTGEVILYAYSDEGFYFNKPQIFNVLFSFNAGMFVYSPILLLSLFGLIFMYKRNKQLALFWLLSFSVVIYFISSWWSWNYVGSFGIRAMIDFYAIFSLPLAFLLDQNKQWRQIIVLPLCGIFLCLSVIQNYQFHKNIYHKYSMNFEKYWFNFLKLSDKYVNTLGGSLDLPPYSKNAMSEVFYYKCNDEKNEKGEHVIQNEFNCTAYVEKGTIPYRKKLLFIEVWLDRMDLTQDASKDAMLVIDYSSENELRMYLPVLLNDIPKNKKDEWKSYYYTFTVQEPKPDESIKVYIWNKEKKEFLVKNYIVKISTVNN